MNQDLVFATIRDDGSVTIEVIGTLGLACALELRHQFERLADRGLGSVEVDFRQAECVTSVGISTLAQMWERSTSASVPIRFVNVSANLRRLFQVSGVLEIFLGAEPPA
ncbi:MAG: STAS domain-containing protein [Candidatus Riflebacteria bacterium]|nr:STAS domain-containing protein [Candidatus Riflebacteria bacterium]